MRPKDKRPQLGRVSRFTGGAKDILGFPPTTVWTIDRSSVSEQEMISGIGDGKPMPYGNIEGFTRGESGELTSAYKQNRKDFRYAHNPEENMRAKASIFSPTLTDRIFRAFGRGEGLVYDPFGGEAVRGILAVEHGYRYLGVEVRGEEVEAVRRRFNTNAVSDRAEIWHGSSVSQPDIGDESADFVLTCPPYWSMEDYSKQSDDVSNKELSYTQFLREMRRIIRETYRILKPGGVACWVIGVHRYPRNKEKWNEGYVADELVSIPHDLVRIHRKVGFVHKEEIIVQQNGTGSQSRYGNSLKGNRFMIRTHEYLEVFIKPTEAKGSSTVKRREEGNTE